MFLLLAALLMEPAVAEFPEPNVTEVEWIEINQVIHPNQPPVLYQVIIWHVWYDKHDRLWHFKPSWRNRNAVAVISTDQGVAVYDAYNDRVWTAKRYLFSVTSFDPERECRTEEHW